MPGGRTCHPSPGQRCCLALTQAPCAQSLPCFTGSQTWPPHGRARAIGAARASLSEMRRWARMHIHPWTLSPRSLQPNECCPCHHFAAGPCAHAMVLCPHSASMRHDLHVLAFRRHMSGPSPQWECASHLAGQGVGRAQPLGPKLRMFTAGAAAVGGGSRAGTQAAQAQEAGAAQAGHRGGGHNDRRSWQAHFAPACPLRAPHREGCCLAGGLGKLLSSTAARLLSTCQGSEVPVLACMLQMRSHAGCSNVAWNPRTLAHLSVSASL